MAAQLQVQDILDAADKDLGLHVLAGRGGLSNVVSVPRVQEPGLALAGFQQYIEPGRVQLFGEAEMAFLRELPARRRRQVIEELCELPLACILVTRNLTAPRPLVEACQAREIPLLRARLPKARLVSRLTRFLEEKLAECTRVHGVLVDVFGLGILLRGKSGVGKSEAALDLVARGHRLVADDVVEIRKVAHKRLLGMASPRIGFHMEIRGLGIINVLDLFGATSTRERMPIDIIVQLVDWADLPNPDRTGLEQHLDMLLDVEIPKVHVPVKPGRNLATIIEVASRNEILKKRGTLTAQEFNERLLVQLRRGTPEIEEKDASRPAAEGSGKRRAADGRRVRRAAKSSRKRKRGKS